MSQDLLDSQNSEHRQRCRLNHRLEPGAQYRGPRRRQCLHRYRRCCSLSNNSLVLYLRPCFDDLRIWIWNIVLHARHAIDEYTNSESIKHDHYDSRKISRTMRNRCHSRGGS